MRAAWRIDPYLAVHLSERFVSPAMHKEIRRLVMANPEDVIESPVAAQILLGDSLSSDLRFQLKVLLAQMVTKSSIYYIGHLLSLLQR